MARRYRPWASRSRPAVLSARGKVLAPATLAAVGSVVSGPGTGIGSAVSTVGDDHPGSVGDLDVVVVGAVGIDTCVYLPGRDIDFSVEANFGENLDYVGQAGGFSAAASPNSATGQGS